MSKPQIPEAPDERAQECPRDAAGRERIVGRKRQTPKAIGQAVGVCPRTVRKWLKRHDSGGIAGLQDRSSRSWWTTHDTARAVTSRMRLTLVADPRLATTALRPTLNLEAERLSFHWTTGSCRE